MLAAIAVALTLLTGCATQKLTPLNVSGVQRLTTAERFSVTTNGIYHGWWDEKPLPGQPTNLAIFSTSTNTVIQRVGNPPKLTKANLEFLRSSKWAANVILVLDPARNRILESFAVDPAGNPTCDSVEQTTINGYIGWWNSTPEDGDVTGLPNETVQINTRTNTVIDGFNRTTKSTHIKYTVPPDPAWPKNSIIIIDTATNKVTYSFPVEADGTPSSMKSHGNGCTP
ncbi:hypothetical protein CVS29_16995 [Arthrobacter psychrochitiniphilus]|uniref:Uncharacterized protein n=2 Tax=Arthrobacter psychrochitiniphilus TaxID=291045 RepID=A0A2V3DNT4_9MICC|nr:hypothetical protein CVS29_16995 [Arthrobacter psychrochitiniphilus]